MTTVPAAIAVTIPVLPIVAIAVLDEDHVPPVVVLLNVVVFPVHTVAVPAIAPTLVAFTDTVAVATHPVSDDTR